MPLSFPKEGPTQHPPWYGKYRPEVEYLCLLIKDQIHMETAVQQFSTQFNVVVIDSHRVHYVTYYRYQQANPTATNKSSPSHHQSAEQWLTQLIKMRNCTPTKRTHQAERDKTTGIYIYKRISRRNNPASPPRLSIQLNPIIWPLSQSSSIKAPNSKPGPRGPNYSKRNLTLLSNNHRTQ
jgi:hypothetical protein